MGNIRFVEKADDEYDFYHFERFVCSFTRQTFRQELEKFKFSSNQIGAFLRLLNKQFPPKYNIEALFKPSIIEAIEHLKSRGFRVWEPSRFSDADMIAFLESHGYCVEGMLDGSYYATGSNSKDSEKIADSSIFVNRLG